jgi:hypothetical protein
LLLLAAALFALFFGFVATGERGGETFFSNPALALPISGAAIVAVAAGGTAIAARRRGDRSLLVTVAIGVGTVVVLWIAAEIAFPH